jgi:hypothetical protein
MISEQHRPVLLGMSINGEVKAIPRQALRVPGGWSFQISRQSVLEGGKFIRSTHRPPLPPEYIPDTHFWVNSRAIVRPEGLNPRKIPMTQSGIKPATFRVCSAVPQTTVPLRYFTCQITYTAFARMFLIVIVTDVLDFVHRFRNCYQLQTAAQIEWILSFSSSTWRRRHTQHLKRCALLV